ncbi:hypothetical protein EUX98_g3351 [Antrodiella citrinella]|uniref:FAD/NAD(P)-binding domain-containing protein n=1 Tax=Antrodiella citrinella TaxID=2447956 RepID=A0A4S4MWS2_9APHY|nr:hypothetical protein EUX98_g3351 [Antrodiella citrinella]
MTTIESLGPKTLPTLDKLKASVPDNLDVQKVANDFVNSFAKAVKANDVSGILSLLHPDAWWRDTLALTWDLRTFQGHANIKQFLTDRLALSKMSGIKLLDAKFAPEGNDLVWILLRFKFETDVALGTGVVRMVPVSTGEWKVYLMGTIMDDLKDYPEQLGPRRNLNPSHGEWAGDRQKEREFSGTNPEVLIIGGGHGGLMTAARLKHLGVSNLIIEKHPRIGDQWRLRYDALCLHDPVWYDHLPYMPFPEYWPTYTPAPKLADWLESYAKNMELNVWNSSQPTEIKQDSNNKWHVKVKRGDGTTRSFIVDHVVFALGFGAGKGIVPNFKGRENFRGQVMHSGEFTSAKDYIGKKVVVVGACTSGHDIAYDCGAEGLDVTMIQRSSTYIMSISKGMMRHMQTLYWEGGPPTAVSDQINNTIPYLFDKVKAVRLANAIAEEDKELLAGLKKAGFRTNMGPEGSGLWNLVLTKGGGYYFDTGASPMIIDGRIKVKSGSEIDHYTQDGFKMKDGAEIKADVVILATGYGDVRDVVRELVDPKIAKKIVPIWDLNEEGELNGTYREIGAPGLWYTMGNLAMARFYSKEVALQIKAKQVGIFGKRYSAPIKM